ncbi:MAG TPA: peptidoglycan DD-metalloendopeptidase family protein [Thermoanaerobaculia bacterium]|nr:peptidoglycan DD-metalloendopeptidase family protein [Thermoanaerobaculia bacterium]
MPHSGGWAAGLASALLITLTVLAVAGALPAVARGAGRLALGAMGASAASGVSAVPAAGPPPSREEQLGAIRAEIGRLSGRLEQARRQQTGLLGELAAADLELQLEQQRLAEALTARDAAAQRAAASAAQVRGLEQQLAQRRREFRHQLTGLYRFGRQGYLRLVFLLRPDRRLLPSIRLLRYLVRRDREALDRFEDAQRRLARQRDRLLAERQELESWLGSERGRRRALVAARTRKAALVARLERERQDLASRASELADKERKLAAFLDLLYGRTEGSLAGAPMQQFRGVLDWPVQGRVAERFGPRLDPRYRTQVPHNGIDLATSPGSEVKAVYPGKVLFAAPFEGYGLTAVVFHPGRVFTLYAGLAELRKAKDDMLSLGDTVGLATDKLYFEIRVENRPDDPLLWLR